MALNQGFKYSETIDHRGAGLSVLDYLSRRYRHSSAAEWRERMEKELILLDGSPPASQRVLAVGQTLAWHRPPWDEPEVPLSFAVIYRDRDLLAVAKPAGLPTLPAGGFLMHTLLTLVRSHYPEAAPVHRLGRGTSGIVLFARTAEARQALHRAFRRHELSKVYRALVCGRPQQDNFSVDVPIGPVPHARLGTVHAACNTGRHAISRVHVLHRGEDRSLLQVRIQTGRPHQIRIHMAAAGYPLLDDPLYAAGGGFKDTATALPGETGYRLHAESIGFLHPTGGRPVRIMCASPPELRIRNQ